MNNAAIDNQKRVAEATSVARLCIKGVQDRLKKKAYVDQGVVIGITVSALAAQMLQAIYDDFSVESAHAWLSGLMKDIASAAACNELELAWTLKKESETDSSADQAE